VNIQLAMSIPNTTYFESLVTQNPVVRESCVDADGYVRAGDAIGVGWEQVWGEGGEPGSNG
jgi:hypothetical protein